MIDEEPADTQRDNFIRLPGLFRRWEIEQVVRPSVDFRIEQVTQTCDGTPLFAVYERQRTNPDTSTE